MRWKLTFPTSLCKVLNLKVYLTAVCEILSVVIASCGIESAQYCFEDVSDHGSLLFYSQYV